jgi:hypothetical protein
MRIRGTYQKGVFQRLKTVKQKQGLPYAYCGNNPMRLIDPTGMGPESPYTYNWNSGVYMDQNGQTVSFGVVYDWLLNGMKAISNAVETIKSKLSSQPKALATDLAITMEFITGSGPEKREFGPNDESTKSLKNSYMTTVALKKFMDKYKTDPSKQSYSVHADFSPKKGSELGPVNSTKNDLGYSTAQFVGSCDYTFRIVGDHVNVWVNNRTSIWSALYHLSFTGAPSREETPLGIGGNIYQTYTFSIPLEEAKKRGNQ